MRRSKNFFVVYLDCHLSDLAVSFSHMNFRNSAQRPFGPVVPVQDQYDIADGQVRHIFGPFVELMIVRYDVGDKPSPKHVQYIL